MTGILANFAALHQAHWQNDAGYRRAWYFWPQASSMLALLLIFNPTDPGGAPAGAAWVKPIAAPGGPAPSGPAPSTAKPTAATQADREACIGKNYDTALDVCSKLIATLAPTDPWLGEAYYNRGRAHSMKGQADLAIADFTQAIAVAPPAPGAVNYRGAVYLDEGNYDLAIADFQTALAAKPNWAIAHANLGLAYFMKNDSERGLAEANEAVRLDPALVWAKTVRLRINSARKQFAEVISDATAAIAAAPTNGEAFYYRGEAKVELGDYRAAATDLAEATRLGYKNFYLDLNKGYVNEQLGNLDQALLDYTAALKTNPKLVYALQKRGEIYFDKRLYADSISNLTALLEIEPKNYDALILRARAKMSAGTNAEALPDIDAALAQRPNEAYAHSLRGAAYLETELATVEPCKKFGQPTADARRWIVGGTARACREGPDIAGSIKDFDEALRLNPALVVAYVDRGLAYSLLGNRKQTAADWRTAYKLDPGDKSILERMRRAGIRP
jgi:tetratricopeptide (TPR) repeat protein